jgi:hypothetical protein
MRELSASHWTARRLARVSRNVYHAGLLTAAVSLAGDDRSTTATVAFAATAALLIVMAVISLLTAGRNTFIAYRLCAPIFSASAILLLAAAAT